MPTYFLYSICILIWGSTWIAITYQLGVVEPVVSVAWRFIAAALLLFGICFLRSEKIRYGPRDHAFLALQGLLMYSAGYVCVHEAEARVVSVAFGAYLTLLGRIGAGRAGYIGVMVPVIAPIISALFENYRWSPATWAGIALAVAGNFVAMGGYARKRV